MYIDSINSQNTDYAISSFQETLINSQANNAVKTIVFPNGYNFDSNLSFNIMFENGHTCTANNEPMTLNGKVIKVYSYDDPTKLVNLPMISVGNNIIWTLKPNTSLELYYDGEQFIVVGNPIVYATNDCDYYANGKVEYKKSIVTTQNKINQSCNVLLQGNQVGSSGYYNVNTACGNTLTFNSCTGVLTATKFCGALDGTASCATNANNATMFANCTYECAKADIRSGRVTILDVTANEHSLALCTGTTTVGISNGCQLKFNSTTGVLTATKFCGSFCGTASNATNFNNKDYSTVCNEIRSGLTDCLGTVTWGDKGDSTFYPITFCTNNSTVGISSCCPFTYNPNTGVACASCFGGNDMCLNITDTCRWGNVPYFCKGVVCNVCYISLYSHCSACNGPIFARVMTGLYSQQCNVFKAMKLASGRSNLSNVLPISCCGGKLGIFGSIGVGSDLYLCNLTYMEYAGASSSCRCFRICYNGGSVIVGENSLECNISYLNMGFIPQISFNYYDN